MSATIDAPVTTRKPDLAGNDTSFHAEIHVFNDDTFPMEIVIVAFHKILPGMTSMEIIMEKIMEIEKNGVATVFQGTREVCELYAEQLNGMGLDAKVV